MKTGPKVSASQRRGSGAEAEVKSRLSYFSIPAKPEPDIGIDFHCELLDEGKPTSKFFGVQAKGTKDLKHWRGTVKRTTIEYWLRLTCPVFLIIYEEKTEKCYWVSIIQNLQKIVKKIAVGSENVYIKIDKAQILEKNGCKNDGFIKAVKDDTFLISLIRGHPQLGEGYVRRSAPPMILSKGVITNLSETIRTNLNVLIKHHLLTDNVKNAAFLCDFLTKFDKAHYDHFFMMGQNFRIYGKKDEAREFFEIALRMCKEDPNWNKMKKPLDPSIEEVINIIETEMKRLEDS